MKKLIILTLVKPSAHSMWKELEQSWNKYFDVEHIIDIPENIHKYVSKHIDILFMDSEKEFDIALYNPLRKENRQFAYVHVTSVPSEKDVKAWKHLADGIVYTGISKDYTIWSTISRLRRYWDTYSKPTTIIYKNIIVDFIEGVVLIDKKKVNLTQKEMDLLKFFLNNKGKYVSKEEAFKKVWDVNDADTTRAFDQIYFKLKKKVGEDFFTVVRNKGIKFN